MEEDRIHCESRDYTPVLDFRSPGDLLCLAPRCPQPFSQHAPDSLLHVALQPLGSLGAEALIHLSIPSSRPRKSLLSKKRAERTKGPPFSELDPPLNKGLPAPPRGPQGCSCGSPMVGSRRGQLPLKGHAGSVHGAQGHLPQLHLPTSSGSWGFKTLVTEACEKGGPRWLRGREVA